MSDLPPTKTNVQLALRKLEIGLLVVAVAGYLLGCGAAQYLGELLSPARLWMGLLTVILLHLTARVLRWYFDRLAGDERLIGLRAEDGDLDALTDQRFKKNDLLLGSLVILAALAVDVMLLLAQRAFNGYGLFLLSLAFLLAFFYGAAPIRLAARGYGELSEAILFTSLFPALGFVLQSGGLHRLLTMMGLPLLALFLAMRLALSLEQYGHDQKYARATMMSLLGWQRGLLVHHGLIVGAYLLFGIALYLGMPWSLTWPALLPLPLAIYQIFQMNQIANGLKPSWAILRLTAVASFGLTLYFLMFAIWTL